MQGIRYIFILAVLLSAAACQERNPQSFEDISGIYFNNRSGSKVLTDSIDVTFVYEKDDILEVPVRVQLIGRPMEEPRPFEISVSSDNAVQGIDFILPEDTVMPAGASYVDYMVTLIRTDALKRSRKHLTLTVRSNEYFSLPVTEMIQVGDTVSTLMCRIYFSDMFTKAPSAWDENLVGEFTQQKFELICKVLDIDPADFNDASVITLAKLLYISAEMTAYVEAEVKKKEQGLPYDEDVIDRESGLPLKFR